MIPLQTAAPHPVSHIVFGPDGTTVAASQAHYGVTVLERASGRTIAVCAMPRRANLTGLTFCGDGKYLAASHAKGLEVFDAVSGIKVAQSFHGDRKQLLVAESGNRLLGVCTWGVRTVWTPDAPRDRDFEWLPGIKTGVFKINALSRDARLVLGTRSDRKVLYDLESDRPVAEVGREQLEPECASFAKFCPLSRRFAINDGHTIDVYATPGTDESEVEQPADTPLVQRANGTQTAVAPVPHTLLTPGFSLKPEKASEVGNWYPPFALLADGRGLLVKRPRNRVQLWDAPTGTLTNEWSWRFEWVTCVAVSTDGLTAVAGGRFGRVLLWDLE